MLHRGVENGEPLSHTGGECHLLGLPASHKRWQKLRMTGLQRDPTRAAIYSAATSHGPFASERPAIAVQWDDSNECGNLFAAQGPTSGRSTISVRASPGSTPALWVADRFSRQMGLSPMAWASIRSACVTSRSSYVMCAFRRLCARRGALPRRFFFALSIAMSWRCRANLGSTMGICR